MGKEGQRRQWCNMFNYSVSSLFYGTRKAGLVSIMAHRLRPRRRKVISSPCLIFVNLMAESNTDDVESGNDPDSHQKRLKVPS